MNILDKYSKKKIIVILSTILSGLVTLSYLFSKIGTGGSSLDDYSSLVESLGAIITFVQIIFYVYVVLAIVIAILSGYYFFKKNNKEYVILTQFITSAINSVLLILSISGINAACKVIRLAMSGDYSSMLTMDYTSMMSSMTSAASNIKYFGYLSVLVFIFNIFIFLVVKEVIHINGFEFSFDEAGEITVDSEGNTININVDGEKAKAAAQNGMNNAKAFFKSKNGKIVIGVVAIVVVAFGGYKVYDTYFNKTTINIMPDVKVEFDGESGQGYIKNVDAGDIDYDKNDVNVKNFIDSIYYDYNNSYNLKNGDKVEIRAVYDKDKAEQLKLEIENDTVEVKVSGLTETYMKASEVPSKISKQIKKDCDEHIEDALKETSYRSYKYEFDSMYLAANEDSRDYVIAVYKIEETTSSETSTYYGYAYVSGVDSSYLDDDDHYVSSRNLRDSSYELVTDQTKIQKALEEQYDDYKLTKFK